MGLATCCKCWKHSEQKHCSHKLHLCRLKRAPMTLYVCRYRLSIMLFSVHCTLQWTTLQSIHLHGSQTDSSIHCTTGAYAHYHYSVAAEWNPHGNWVSAGYLFFREEQNTRSDWCTALPDTTISIYSRLEPSFTSTWDMCAPCDFYTLFVLYFAFV